MTNRRQFIKGSAAALLVARQLRAAAAPARQGVWLGSCARTGGGIYHAWLDTKLGALSDPVLAADTPQPSWLDTLPDARGREILYSVNELGGTNGAVSAFLMDKDAGTLTPLNQVSSVTGGPTYIGIQKATRTLYTANFGSSSVTVFHLLPDGQLTPAIQHLDMKDTARFGAHLGPGREQKSPHPHSVVMTPDQTHAIVSDLGNDSVYNFAIDADGKLGDSGPAIIPLPPGTGPRHFAFHPNGRWGYGLNEVGKSLQRYEWSSAKGELKLLPQNISSMAPDEPDPGREITAAEIMISPDGKYLYATTRGVDTLTVYDIAPKTGELSFRQRIPTGGREPRHFNWDASTRWIVCSNGQSSQVTVFRRDIATSKVTGPLQTLKLGQAEFALFT
jgi:6-phosphogluconolactonase